MALETPDLPSQNQFSPKVLKLPNCKKTVSVLQCQATPEYLSSMLPLQFSQRRYIYCIYLYPQGFHAPILCRLQLQLLACAALADCLPSAITCQAKKNTQEDITEHITCFLLNSSMITSVLPLARDRDDGTQMLQTMFRCHMSTVSP